MDIQPPQACDHRVTANFRYSRYAPLALRTQLSFVTFVAYGAAAPNPSGQQTSKIGRTLAEIEMLE